MSEDGRGGEGRDEGGGFGVRANLNRVSAYNKENTTQLVQTGPRRANRSTAHPHFFFPAAAAAGAAPPFAAAVLRM